MSQINHALYLESKQSPEMVVWEAPYPSPTANEIVIRTKAVAMNPADNAIQKAGLLVTEYPAIVGCDVAGIVEEVGSDLASKFKSGDRVTAATNPLAGYKYSAFQEFVVAKLPMPVKIPDNVELSDAVVLPLGTMTAASCLFEPDLLGLNLPPSEAGNGETLLVWGGSSSVGCCGIQLAVAAGYEVFAIASARNHDLLESIGAVHSFDYHDANLVQAMISALDGKDVVGALDAISNKESLSALCEILHQINGRRFIASIMPGAEANAKHDVVIRSNLAITPSSDANVNHHVFQIFLGTALAEGKFLCKPNADVVDHGLGEVQRALDVLAGGVSAKKLVLTL